MGTSFCSWNGFSNPDFFFLAFDRDPLETLGSALGAGVTALFAGGAVSGALSGGFTSGPAAAGGTNVTGTFL